MKTTQGKTRTLARKRCVWIYDYCDRLMAVRESATLKAGLEDYWKTHLSNHYEGPPVYVGNVLTCRTHAGVEVTFTAKEAK